MIAIVTYRSQLSTGWRFNLCHFSYSVSAITRAYRVGARHLQEKPTLVR